MIVLLYIQNLITTGPAISEILSLIKIGTHRQTDRQTDGKGRPLFYYSRSHETPRKHESDKISDGFDYYTSLGNKDANS